MSTILQHDSAAKLVDAISSACNDESVKATLQPDVLYTSTSTNNTTADFINTPQFNDNTNKFYDDADGDVDDIDLNDTSSSAASSEDYTGSDDLSPTSDVTPPLDLPLSHVRTALSQLSAAARLIDRLSAGYDAEDAQDLLGDLNAWHSFEDYTETIDALYDGYRTALYAFADATSGRGAAAATGQGEKEVGEGGGKEEDEVSAEAYRNGMQALAKVLRGSCDPLPYRLRQVHTALVGSAGSGAKKSQETQHQDLRREEEARVLLRAANDRCIEEADDFIAYYTMVRRLFLHLVASEAKAVMVMAVALHHGSVPHYIQPSDITIARQLLAEQDAFLNRIIPGPVVRLAERVLSPSTGDCISSSAVKVTLRTYNAGHEIRLSAEGSDGIVCAGSSQVDQHPFIWSLECAQPLPKDGDAVGRYTFRIRSESSTTPTYLGCDDTGDIKSVTEETGTWRIAAVQVEDQPHPNGKAAAGAAIPVAFRLQYRSADVSGGKGHGKWLASGPDGARLGLRTLEDESQDFLVDISVVEG